MRSQKFISTFDPFVHLSNVLVKNDWREVPRDEDGKWTDGAAGTSAAGSSEFKEWFKGSQVVDERGNPKVIYHQTNNDFDNFKDGWDGVIWTAEDTEYYEHLRYGDKTIPIYANAKKILDLTPLGDHIKGDQFGDFLKKHGIDFQWIPKAGVARTYVPFTDGPQTFLVDKIKAAGYDAVYLPIHSTSPVSEGRRVPIKSYNGYLFFNAEQLRFADGRKATVKNYLHSIYNFEEVVPRAPAGTSTGGQWVGENTVTTEKEALKAMRKYQAGLSNDELDAVAEYTGSDYYEINRSLRDGEETILIDRLDVIKTHLDKVLENGPKFHGETYRGIEFSSLASYEKFATGLENGMVVADKAFLSTSLEQGKAEKFTHSMYHVAITIKGRRGVFLNGLSADEKEKEVLFPRKTKFKVVGFEETKFKDLARKIILRLEEL